MMVWALSGGKVASSGFWYHLISCMKHLGFESLLVYPDIWMSSSNHADKIKYRDYVILYFLNCLVVSDKGKDFLKSRFESTLNSKKSQFVHPPSTLVDRYVKLG